MKSLFSVVVILACSVSTIAQGIPGTLKCAFQGGLDVHASRLPSSPVVARVQCGDPVLLISSDFGAPQIRTVDGREGYITTLRLGQWTVESLNAGSALSAPVAAAAPIAPPTSTITRQVNEPRRAEEFFRRFDIDATAFSWNRQGSLDLFGGGLTFATNATEHVGVVADLSLHRSLDEPTAEIIKYRFGPRFTFPRFGRVTSFTEVLVGGMRLTASISVGSITVRDHINGFTAGAGGGLDIHVKPWLAVRAFKADYSYLRIAGGDSQGLHVGSGLVFRFGS